MASLGAGPAPAQRQPAASDLGARVYNVRGHGAKGDGKTLDTTAFQTAIDACTGDQGGTVLVPAGEFLIGTIVLKNNVTLHLAPQAHVLGSTDINHYTSGREQPGNSFGRVLIYAADAENVSIEGRGTIDGQGEKYLDGAKDDGEKTQGRRRPHLLEFVRCKRLTLRDVSLVDSAYWCTRITQCSFVKVDGVSIHSRVNFNNDGLHFTSCEHVKVSNCEVACEDDACALFGSNRDVTVANCTFSTRWSVFRFGGGVCRNVTVSNCVIQDTFGCPIKMQVRSGDRMENMIFSNLVMDNVTGPIYIGLGTVPRNSMNPAETKPGGVVRNILFEGIRATVAEAPDLTDYPYLVNSTISGVYPGEHRTCIELSSVAGQFIENVSFNNVQITYAGGGTAREGALRSVPQMSGGEYFSLGVLPAYGMYARNVRGLTLNNVRFEVAKADLRPALFFDHVEDATVSAFAAQGNLKAESLVRFIDVRDVMLSGCRVLKSAARFLQVEGARNRGIVVDGGDLSGALVPVYFSLGASKETVKVRE